MKILKEETYSKLLKEIEDLKQQKTKLEKSECDLHNEVTYFKKIREEYASFATETKMNFSIKRIIVGRRSCGKTTFIKSILSKIPNYFVIDPNGEYTEIDTDRKFIPDVNLKGDELKEKLKQVVLENKHKTLIIEEQVMIPDFINWFMLNSRDFNFIITSQSKKRIEAYIDDVDFIYDFGTIDEFNNKPNDNKIMLFKKTGEISKSNGSYRVKSNVANAGLTGLLTLSIVFLGLVAISRS